MTLTAHEDKPMAKDLTGCLDCDAHEMIPSSMWEETFGETGRMAHEITSKMALLTVDAIGDNALVRDEITGDVSEATEENVWGVRGAGAPSAIDLGRRNEVLDVMGVDKQLVFPTFGIIGLMLAYNPMAHLFFDYDPAVVDRVKQGRDIMNAHNDWCIRTIRSLGDDRARPVGVLFTDSVDQMMADAERLLADGIQAVMIPNAVPPADTSPADPALDPFWSLFESANVPITFHLGTEFALLASASWSNNVAAFVPSVASSFEFPIEPYRGATISLTSENFLTAMILGGVLERHPDLRVGNIEVGSHWIGPLAERLDSWADEFARRLAPVLSMKPSEYLDRQVRVTPFPFEDVASYFDRYPQISHSYCFATDFPHVEGGKYSKRTYRENLSGADATTIENFFVRNGSLLFPTP